MDRQLDKVNKLSVQFISVALYMNLHKVLTGLQEQT